MSPSPAISAQTENDYDSQGRVYESRTYYVDPTIGTLGDYLPTDTWYDSRGNAVATRTGDGPIQKSVYDSADELVETYTCADNVATADLTFADVAGVNSGDTVVEQTQTWYDADGNVVATADYQRLPGDTTTEGAMDATDSYVTAAASFYDAAGRDIEDVNYGRQDVIGGATTSFFHGENDPNGAWGSLVDLNGDGIPDAAEGTPPARQTAPPYTCQVTTTAYNATSAAGPIVDTTDNAGSTTETQSDLLGRTVRTIQNFDRLAYGATGSGFDASGNVLETDTAQDLTTDYQYDSYGRMVTMTVYDAKGAASGVEAEPTRYLYGGPGSPADASFQTGVVEPDSTDTLATDSNGDWWFATDNGDHTSTTYDLLGEPLTATDQRGVVHTYSYDSAGRQTADTITNFGGTGQVDDTVNAIVTAYDDLGRVHTVSSEGLVDRVETVLNQVQDRYDGWGNLVQQWQSPNGAVQTSGGDASPSVQYVHDDGAVLGAASYVRLTALTYPNGRDVCYGYGATGAVDDIMSRFDSISDLSGGLASYDYLGAGTVASVSYPQPGLSLDYSADNFAAWDQFGEVLNQAWKEGSTTVDGYSYTYDQSGNRQTRANLTDAALSETYTYDGLDRLTSVTNDSTSTVTEQWTLDSLGNFVQSSEGTVSQSRTTDASNEITSINGSTATTAYDAAGNMMTMPQPGNGSGTLTCTFDAWNRLTQVTDSNGNIIAQYQYDGTGRLVEELSNFTGTTPGTVTYSFYDGQNAVETRTGTASSAASSLSPQYQYVFAPGGSKTPILRDDFTTGTAYPRLYYTSDVNTNVTGLVDASGQVVERYVYSAYGVVTIYTSDWSSTLASSAVGNNTLYASMVLDPATGMFYDDARWYDASTSTFVSQDPAMADSNLYRYCGNDPLVETDPTGLDGTYPFTVGGYKAKIMWSEGAWWSIGAGYWGQPSIRSGGGINEFSNGLATTATVWGHYTCNTIIGSFASNSGVMRKRRALSGIVRHRLVL